MKVRTCDWILLAERCHKFVYLWINDASLLPQSPRFDVLDFDYVELFVAHRRINLSHEFVLIVRQGDNQHKCPYRTFKEMVSRARLDVG